jgi:hypothetical protein
MRIITLEEHLTILLFREDVPHNPALAAVVGQRGKQVGVDIGAELLNFGSSPLVAKDGAGSPYRQSRILHPVARH